MTFFQKKNCKKIFFLILCLFFISFMSFLVETKNTDTRNSKYSKLNVKDKDQYLEIDNKK